MSITLDQARTVIEGALTKARSLDLKPVSVMVLDNRGSIVAAASEDGVSAMRAKIAHAQFLVHRSQYAKAVPLLKSAQAKRPRDSVQRYLDQVVKLSRLAKG